MGVFDQTEYIVPVALDVPEPLFADSVNRAALDGTMPRWIMLDLDPDMISANNAVTQRALQGPVFNRDTLVVACRSDLSRELRIKLSTTKPQQRLSNGYLPLWAVAGWREDDQAFWQWPLCVPRGERLRANLISVTGFDSATPQTGLLTFLVIELE